MSTPEAINNQRRNSARGLDTPRAELRLLWDSRSNGCLDTQTQFLSRFFCLYYEKNGRSFPWRTKHTTAFALLVAEVLLKQTKAVDVVTVWSDLMDEYPDPECLAYADREKLLRLLKPLGLQRQRCYALKMMAKAVVKEHAGKVPKEIPALIDLPFIGLYSACALASFIYDFRVPIVDANVLRVFSRLTGENFGKDLRRSKEVWQLAWSILPHKRHKEHNYGLLDFSALLCTSRNPGCTRCELTSRCFFGLSDSSLK